MVTNEFQKEQLMNSRARFVLGILLSALSGALLLLSFPPYGIWWLVWIAFIPGIFAQYRLFSIGSSSLAPAIYLLVWLGPYMARLFGTEFGPFFTYLGVIIAFLGYLLYWERRFIERTGYRWFVLQGVVSWVGFEMIRATFIPVVATSAFIGYTQATQIWLIQPVSIFSIYGLNLIIMLVNYALAQGLIAWYDRRQDLPVGTALPLRLARSWMAAGGVLTVAWIAASLLIFTTAPKDNSTLRVAALRANYSLPAHQDTINTSQVRFDTFARQARDAASQGAQVLFTSEMMFNFDPQVEFTDEFRSLASETGTHIFISYSVLTDGEPRLNQAVLLSPDGTFSNPYNKTHLPPGERYDVAGGIFPVFSTSLGQMATFICHDGNYTDVTRSLVRNGAQLIAAPFKEFVGFGEQLWQNVTFRAVENRAAMVVTGATSVTAIIAPNGKQIALDVNRSGSSLVLVGDVTLGTGSGTPYTAAGDILGWTALGGFGVFIFYRIIEGILSKRKQKSLTELSDLEDSNLADI
jgi:apolipoprotein N-acyltransferase